MQTGSMAYGRHRESAAWDYFHYVEECDESECLVLLDFNGGQQKCGARIKGKNATNLKAHLEQHPTVCHEMTEKERARIVEKDERETSHPKRKEAHAVSRHPEQPLYPPGSLRKQELNRKLALLMAVANVPKSFVDLEEFHDFVRELDPRYEVACCSAIAAEQERLLRVVKEEGSKALAVAERIAITTDIWSKKSLTESFLGMTAHFFSMDKQRIQSITLAVRKFPPPHTAARVLDVFVGVLREWNIAASKVCPVMTDNGSNLVAAFKDSKQLMAETARTELKLKTKSDQRAASEREIESQRESSDEAEMETSSSEENVDISNDSDAMNDAVSRNISLDVSDFDKHECDHDCIFIGDFKRVSCFSHTLQCVVRQLYNGHQKIFGSAIGAAHKLVTKFNSSGNATVRLIELSNKKLIADCPTRWSSTYILVARLLELRSHVKTVCAEKKWANLHQAEYQVLEDYSELLEPFAKYTGLLSAEAEPTFSCVIPALMDLQIHLDSVRTIKAHLIPVCDTAIAGLAKRFDRFMTPTSVNFEPIFLAATFLDPRYRILLKGEQATAAKRAIAAEEGQATPDSSEPSFQVPEPEPSTKRFRHLSTLISEMARAEADSANAILSPMQMELDRYDKARPFLKEDGDLIAFWLHQRSSYPLLSRYALNLCAVPASTTPAERVFSVCGDICARKRNKAGGHGLERKVLIALNKQFLSC